MNKQINIAVDGTAGSGKSATMKRVAKTLDYKFIDTGFMYRAFTKYCVLCNVDFTNNDSIIKLLDSFEYKVDSNENVTVNNENYNSFLSDVDVIMNINKITVIPEVRTFMVKVQKKLGKNKGNILVGRDITTVVLPEAEVKIYLDSSVEARAKRRYEQNIKNDINDISYEEIYKLIEERDYSDKNRETGPLKIADDAIVVDNSEMTLEETIEYVLNIIKEKI